MISTNTSTFIYSQPQHQQQQRLVYKKTQYTPEFVLQLRREVFFSVLKYMGCSQLSQIDRYSEWLLFTRRKSSTGRMGQK